MDGEQEVWDLAEKLLGWEALCTGGGHHTWGLDLETYKVPFSPESLQF